MKRHKELISEARVKNIERNDFQLFVTTNEETMMLLQPLQANRLTD